MSADDSHAGSSRTFLLLQAIIALCCWLLLVLSTGRWLFGVRDAWLADRSGGVEASTLVGAGLVLLLSVVLLAIAIQRFHRFTQAPKEHGS